MKRILTATALVAALMGTGAAFASERCFVPMTEWQPREALQQKLTAEGWKVYRIKTDDGCYEVRGTDAQGRRVEASFDPKTFEMVNLETKR